jgi:toxin ParE1/3/4
MGYKVVLTQQAIEELAQIVIFIAGNDPEAALPFGNSLIDHAQKLADFPYLGRPVHKRRGVRQLTHAPYLIFYRLNNRDRAVEVLRFWHAARGKTDLA